MRVAIIACGLSMLALSACDAVGDSRPAATASPTTVAEQIAPTAGATIPSTPSVDGFSVPDLGLTFELAESFVREAEGDYAFRARSFELRAVLTIYPEGPGIVDHTQGAGETVQNVDLGPGITAVMVLDAAVVGLPTGVSANELLVSHGDQSFRVIMSVRRVSLNEAWSVFISSVKVATPG